MTAAGWAKIRHPNQPSHRQSGWALCFVLLSVWHLPASADDGQPAAAMPADQGQVWREYDISPYTSALPAASHPERVVVQWIVDQTGADTWHGPALAVLSASASRLRVYHRPEVQQQVAAIVNRFVNPPQPCVRLRVQVLPGVSPDWRQGLIHLLRPAARGPEGQQAWLLAPEDMALIRSRLPILPAADSRWNRSVVLHNGQQLDLDLTQPVHYISAVELAPGAYTAYRPVLGQLQIGVKASLWPLWTASGDAADLGFELTTRRVVRLHASRSLAPLAGGSQTTFMHVPEVASTTLKRTVRCPVGQTLLISLGTQPGLLQRRVAWANLVKLRGDAELLIIIDLAPAATGSPPTPWRPVPPPAAAN